VSALREAGFTGATRRAVKLLGDFDLSTIEPDGKGFFDPDDFEDVVEDLKEEWPELFEAKRPASRRRATRDDDDDDDEPRRRSPRANRSAAPPQTSSGTSNRKLSADEKFAMAIAKQAGYRGVESQIRAGRG
jgi:hypothetical protein